MDHTKYAKTGAHRHRPRSPRKDPSLDAEFEATARALGFNPSNRWIGGYIEYEWEHVRHFFENGIVACDGKRVLEFGCHVGATATVLALLGAKQVVGVDVDARTVRLAKLNAKRYGIAGQVSFMHIPDTRLMPWPDGAFELIICNSVFESIPHTLLPSILCELDRLLKPGGELLVCGTSNRLWPVEMHSRMWLVNYLPRCLENKIPGRQRYDERALWPWELHRAFRGYTDLLRQDRGRALLRTKRAMGDSRLTHVLRRFSVQLASYLRLSPGVFAPTLTLALRKPA